MGLHVPPKINDETVQSENSTIFQKFRKKLSISSLTVQTRRSKSNSSLEDRNKNTVHKKKRYKSKKNSLKIMPENLNDEKLNAKTVFANRLQVHSLQFIKKRPIKLAQKFYEFFVAPITTFWSWTISYIIFLFVFIYVLLVKTPLYPSVLEWFLLAYVGCVGMELVRRFINLAPNTFKEKWEIFSHDFWNTITMLAVIGFLIGFTFRLLPNTMIPTNLPMGTSAIYYVNLKKDYSRIVLALDSILWVMKILDYLSVHSQFGPYITAVGKMILNASYIIILLAIALLAFGLPRQSISFPNEDWHWILLRNVFYKPYFMVYGEVYADEIDLCDDDAWEDHLNKGIPLSDFNETNTIHCVPGYWIPPILMTAFLIITTFLLLSMLIATFNRVFDGIRQVANQVWLFQRYHQVIQYECTPCIPPPFTPLYYVYMLFKYINFKKNIWYKSKKFEKSEKNTNGNEQTIFEWSLKLYLTDDQLKNLHDFEEECMEDLTREKLSEKSRSTEERIKKTAEKTDTVCTKLNTIENEEINFRQQLNDMNTKIQDLTAQQTIIINYLEKLSEINKNEKVTQTTNNEDKEENRVSKTRVPYKSDNKNRILSSDSDSDFNPNTAKYFQKSSGSNRNPRRNFEYTSITDSIAVPNGDFGPLHNRGASSHTEENSSIELADIHGHDEKIDNEIS